MDNENHVAHIEKQIFSGARFTYGALCVGPWDSRLPDKLIQRHRRKGHIAFERIGRTVTWSLTEKGMAEKARRDGGANG